VVNLFGEVFGNATRSITGNQALVSKIYLPSELFPWASMIVALVHFLPQLLVLVVGALLFGWLPSTDRRPRLRDSGLVILVVFTMGLGMITAALNAAFRDVENFVDLIVMVATWLSPVLYRISMVQDAIGGTLWWWLYQLNPLTIVVELFHVAFWRYAPPVVDAVPADPSLVAPGRALRPVVGGAADRRR
jgi:ABC-2 type transport system permease protein